MSIVLKSIKLSYRIYTSQIQHNISKEDIEIKEADTPIFNQLNIGFI